MRFHCLDADMQLFGNLFVGTPFGDQQQHFFLPVRQAFVCALRCALTQAASSALGRHLRHDRHSFDGAIQRIDQLFQPILS